MKNKDKSLSFTNKKGEHISLSSELLEKAVALKLEFQRANGNCSWGKLAKILRNEGYSGIDNSENFRVAVRRYQKKIGKLPTQEHRTDLQIKALKERIGELNLQKRDLQNTKREFNKLKRVIDDKYLWEQRLYESVPKVLNPEQFNNKNNTISKLDGNTLVVYLSDLHIGLKNNKYNYATLKKYISQYLDYINNYVKSTSVKQIDVVGLGDFIEGAYLHTTQLYELEFDFSTQVGTMLNFILGFLSSLPKNIPVSFTAIPGNHDRSNAPNKKDNIFGDSAITILNMLVKNQSKVLNIKYVKPTTVARHLLKINGVNIACVHGDLDHLKDGRIISKLSAFFGDRVDTVVGGHLHSFFMQTLGYNQYIIQSSSAFPGNSYSDSLGVKNTPGQVMLDIDKNGLVIPLFVPFR